MYISILKEHPDGLFSELLRIPADVDGNTAVSQPNQFQNTKNKRNLPEPMIPCILRCDPHLTGAVFNVFSGIPGNLIFVIGNSAVANGKPDVRC